VAAAVVVLMVSSERWWRCSGEPAVVVAMETVAARGVGDRVDRETSNPFGFVGKIPPEKSPAVVAGGEWWWPAGWAAACGE
nr:hypothetical protein [Tanacetum cinerariifolium]